MPLRPIPVIVKASRTEIVEFIVEVMARNPSEAEAQGMSEGRRELRKGELPQGWTRKATPWHVIDAIPLAQGDGPPRPG